jgi:hypothetical protein
LKILFILKMWVMLVDVPLTMFNSNMWHIFHSFGLPNMFLQIIYFGIRKRSLLCTLLQHKQWTQCTPRFVLRINLTQGNFNAQGFLAFLWHIISFLLLFALDVILIFIW